MEIYKSDVIPSVTIIKSDTFLDKRGEIWTSYDESLLSLLPKGMRFVHDKFASSKKNVLRGMHGDNKTWKLISCISGQVFQAIIDLRLGSPTFKQSVTFILSPGKQILIPPGFLNGYYAYIDSVYHYKLAYTGDYVDAKDQMTMRWNDPTLNIKWPQIEPILQKRDE
jgi:dTDP-4-dehydrorhamnose 3,5-epimerase